MKTSQRRKNENEHHCGSAQRKQNGNHAYQQAAFEHVFANDDCHADSGAV